MKNKVLATLLAVCLFAGLAVPAFADYSSQSGLDEDVKTMEFVKDSYTVKNGGDPVDLSDEVRAYASNKQLVQEANIVWSLENDDKFAFGISDDGVVTASEDAGTATVIATGKDGKVIAKTKVVAAKNVIVNATGFQFDGTTKVLKYGIETMAYGKTDDEVDYKDQTIDVVATPKDAVFTKAQLDAVESALDSAITAGAFDITDGVTTVSPDVARKANKLVLVYKTGATAAVKPAVYTYTVSNIGTAVGVVKIAGVEISIDPTAKTGTQDTIPKMAAHLTKAINANSTVWKAEYTAGNSFAVTARQGNYSATAPVDAEVKSGADAFAATVATAPQTVGTEMAGLTGTKIDAKRSELSVEFPNANEKITAKPTIKKSVSISGVPAVAVSNINAAGTITLEVGEKVSTANMFKQTPSKANITFNVDYANDYVDGNATASDYAVLTNANADDASEIIGVAVGTNRIIATIKNIDGKAFSASIIVKVIEKGTKPAAEGTTTTVLSNWTPKLGVGETANIVVKATAAVTYTSLATDIVTVDAAGKLTAVKEGTAKVKVQEEGKDAVYLTVTIGAATTKPADKPTDVPQTAVAALVALF